MRTQVVHSKVFRMLALLVLVIPLRAEVTEEDYARAERFLPEHLYKQIYKMEVIPNWIGESHRFWYKNVTREGMEFVLIDPIQNKRSPAFDHVRLAAALSLATGRAYVHNNLPFDSFEYDQKKNVISFDVQKTHWVCDLSSYQCTKDEDYTKPPEDELKSPDENWAAFVKEHNLYVRSFGDEKDIQLTTDGENHYGYAGSQEGINFITNKILGKKRPPAAVWSPDSKKIITHRLDLRKVKDLHIIQHAPPDGSVRPVLHTYKYPMPGDEHLPLQELVILDVANKTLTPVQHEGQQLTFLLPVSINRVFWSKDSRKIYYCYHSRDERTVRFFEIDAATGITRGVLKEEGSSFVELTLFENPNVRVLDRSQEFIWYSQHDGWAHLYLYDLKTGKRKFQITRGPWVVFSIKHVDEDNRWIYFTAFGREIGRDLYHLHLYRSKLDGSQLELLTPEDGDHHVKFSSSGKYFVDSFSRLDRPPVSVLRSADGELLQTLEEADMTNLFEMGWKQPERFSVKAADGVTDIYCAIVHPINFDPDKKYPVIDAVYPGPQIIMSPPSYLSFDKLVVDWGVWEAQALAELGFVVVTIDGRGTPFRSKAFHDFAYKNFKEGGALQDHIAAFRQMAQSRPYIDLSRVGIYGHSGGGFASTRAILLYPDFYKVAVSSAGNHDQRGYNAGWGEKYQGLLEGDNYDDQINARLAKNLRGKLFLIHGEMDDNVHPALTLQVVDALVKENKDFELLIIPNNNHGYQTAKAYCTRKKWDYFVKHLLNEEPPREYKIVLPKDSK